MIRAAALIAVTCLTVTTAVQADPVKLRVGGVAPSGDLVEILFAKPGIAKHLDTSYSFEPIHFRGTPAMMTATASGDLDIAVFSYSSFGLAIENAKMDDLRILMDGFQDGVPGHYSDGYLVLKDSPIRAIEDLKGKVVATPGIGTARDVALRAMLRSHHLEEKKDYTIIEIAMTNMKAILLEKKADLIAASTLMAQDTELSSASRTLFTQTDAMGTTEEIVFGARQDFITKNRAAIIDFLEDALRARRFYFDPANHKEAVAIVAQFTKQPPEQLDPWLFTDHDYYRDPNGQPNMKALQANLDLLRQLGFLKTQIEAQRYAALDLVGEAAKRLK